MATLNGDFREGNPELRARASALLYRYPNIDPAELAELIAFYNSAPAIDTALLTCDPFLYPHIVRFQTDQKRQLHHNVRVTMLLWLVAAFTVLIAFAVVMGPV